MEKVTGYTNLFRRNATYYFRAKVPKDLIEDFGKTEVRFSLKTKDKPEAVSRWREASSKVEREFARRREAIELSSRSVSEIITDEFIQSVEDVMYWAMLYTDEDIRINGVPDLEGGRFPFSDNYSRYSESVMAKLKEKRLAFASGDLSELLPLASWYLSSFYGKDLDENTPELRKLARGMQRAFLRAGESIQRKNEGELVATPETPKVELSGHSRGSTKDVPLLSQVMEDWIKDKERSGSWKGKTSREHRVAVESFIGMSGDRPFTDYTKGDARAFKEALLTIPPNWKRRSELKGMNIHEAALKASSLGIPPMTPKNAKKKLQFVGNLWRWLLGSYDEIESSIFDGITIRVTSDKRNERHAFTLEELNAIFSSPVFTGCQSEGRWMDKGNHSLKDTAKYWAPLIALYSGARMGEILQLHLSDIKEHEGIYYMDINDDNEEKTLKTVSSRRNIPLHKNLINAGFLDHVSLRRNQGEVRVFPEVDLCADGTYTAAFSKYFSRFLEAINVKHDKNSFHSFRHTFEDACRNNGIPKAVMDALQGHTERGMSGTYGSGYSLEVLNEEIQKVDYRGLELRLLG